MIGELKTDECVIIGPTLFCPKIQIAASLRLLLFVWSIEFNWSILVQALKTKFLNLLSTFFVKELSD